MLEIYEHLPFLAGLIHVACFVLFCTYCWGDKRKWGDVQITGLCWIYLISGGYLAFRAIFS